MFFGFTVLSHHKSSTIFKSQGVDACFIIFCSWTLFLRERLGGEFFHAAFADSGQRRLQPILLLLDGDQASCLSGLDCSSCAHHAAPPDTHLSRVLFGEGCIHFPGSLRADVSSVEDTSHLKMALEATSSDVTLSKTAFIVRTTRRLRTEDLQCEIEALKHDQEGSFSMVS